MNHTGAQRSRDLDQSLAEKPSLSPVVWFKNNRAMFTMKRLENPPLGRFRLSLQERFALELHNHSRYTNKQKTRESVL